MIAAKALGDERGCGAPERRGVACIPTEREAAQEAGRERVAAAGGVDHVDVEGCDPFHPVSVGDDRALAAAGGDDAPHASIECWT